MTFKTTILSYQIYNILVIVFINYLDKLMKTNKSYKIFIIYKFLISKNKKENKTRLKFHLFYLNLIKKINSQLVIKVKIFILN
jgi:hypothetical protein